MSEREKKILELNRNGLQMGYRVRDQDQIEKCIGFIANDKMIPVIFYGVDGIYIDKTVVQALDTNQIYLALNFANWETVYNLF